MGRSGETEDVNMSEISWTVSGGGGSSVPSVYSEKHPFISEKRVTEGLSDGQKLFIRDFNSMRNMLVKYDLMEKR